MSNRVALLHSWLSKVSAVNYEINKVPRWQRPRSFPTHRYSPAGGLTNAATRPFRSSLSFYVTMLRSGLSHKLIRIWEVLSSSTYSHASGVLSVSPVKFSDSNLNKTTPTACRILPLLLYSVSFYYVSAVLKRKRFRSPDCTFAADKETTSYSYSLALK